MTPIILAVYKTGGDYTKEYVDRLFDGVVSNTSLSLDDVLCLTDSEEDFYYPTKKLEHNLPGWWSKLELFKITNKPCVYFDLDTVIHKDINDFVWHNHSMTMLKGLSGTGKPASGVMAWNGDYRYLLDEFNKEMIAEYTPGNGGKMGDQAYIAEHLGFVPDYIQDLFPGIVCSRKYEPIGVRKETPIVCYHGKPRPQDTGWTL